MKKQITSIFFLILAFDLIAQDNKFVTFEDSIAVIANFQMDIIEKEGFEKSFMTYFPDFYTDSVIVYENFIEDETPIGQGDPLCLWVNKSIIDTIGRLRWIQIKELREANNWVYLKLNVMDKEGDNIKLWCSCKYKIRTEKIGILINGRTGFKKIKNTCPNIGH